METPKGEQQPQPPELTEINPEAGAPEAIPPVILPEDPVAAEEAAEKLRSLNERAEAPSEGEAGPKSDALETPPELEASPTKAMNAISAWKVSIFERIRRGSGPALSGRTGKVLMGSMAGAAGIGIVGMAAGAAAGVSGISLGWEALAVIPKGLGILEIVLGFPFIIGWGAERIRKLVGSGGGGGSKSHAPSGGGHGGGDHH